MALTTESIHAAADKISADGINPTQTNVREALGGGSYSTIGAALKSWKQEQVEHEQLRRTDMPDSLRDEATVMVAKLWQEADQIANSNLSREREALAITAAKAQAEIDDAQIAIQTLETEQEQALELLRLSVAKADKATSEAEAHAIEITSLNTFLTDLQHKLQLEQERTATATAAVTDTNGKLDATRAKLDTVSSELSQSKADIATAMATISSQGADIERLNNDVAERKQLHQVTIEQLTERTAERDDLAKQLAAVSGKLEAVTEQSKQLLIERDSAVTDNKALSAANSKLDTTNERLIADIADMTAERDNALVDNQALQDEIAKLRAATAKK